jgi:hypothetical protein
METTMDMSNEDLARLRSIAEEGRAAPLLGGAHLLLWGGAMTIALLINWAVADGMLPWPGWSLAISWLGIALAAWIGSFLLGRSKEGKPGEFTIGNRIERAVWTSVGAFLSLLALALFARASFEGDAGAWALFSIMPPVGFGAYAIALTATAVAAGGSRLPAWLSLGFAVATTISIGDPSQYLIAAAGVALVTLPGGFRQLRAEPRAE